MKYKFFLFVPIIAILIIIFLMNYKSNADVETNISLDTKVEYLEKEVVRTRRTATGGLILGGLSAILSLIAISRIKP